MSILSTCLQILFHVIGLFDAMLCPATGKNRQCKDYEGIQAALEAVAASQALLHNLPPGGAASLRKVALEPQGQGTNRMNTKCSRETLGR